MLPYGIIGNCKTCALVKQDASIDWFCFPTFASPSVFARLLDEERGGALRIVPKGKYRITQRYLPSTAILETTFRRGKNAFQVIDFFPRYRRITRRHTHLLRQNKLIRIIKPLSGTPELRVAYEPRPGYAKRKTQSRWRNHQLVTTAGDERISLKTNIKELDETFPLKRTAYLVVGEPDDSLYSARRCTQLLNATKRYWERWVGTLVTPKRHRELIVRSAITLKLLTFSKTGAIMAAATTSLPEEVGTSRTFDYRLCWVRDAAFAVDALKKIGRDYEPKKLIEFVMKLGLEHDNVQIIYGIDGETRLRERALTHLAGFRGSRPVRIGNAAYNQEQHDIYGELIDILYLYYVYYEYETKVARKVWRFLEWLVNQIKAKWERKDSGIWEFRGKHRHYLFSKLMCWVGVDRAIKVAQHYGKDDLVHKWLPIRDEIGGDINHKGYSKKRQAFTMFYGSTHLDASVLQMTYHEFLPQNDPRLVNTVRAVYEELRHGELVQRYAIRDDFGVSKSAFTICSFWLVDALMYIGEDEKAQELFKNLTDHANHLGLFSEDIDIASGQLIGNFPQAYTHIALINSSILLSEWSSKRKKIDWHRPSRRQRWL